MHKLIPSYKCGDQFGHKFDVKTISAFLLIRKSMAKWIKAWYSRDIGFRFKPNTCKLTFSALFFSFSKNNTSMY